MPTMEQALCSALGMETFMNKHRQCPCRTYIRSSYIIFFFFLLPQTITSTGQLNTPKPCGFIAKMESYHGSTLCFPNYFEVKLQYSENAGFEIRCGDKIKPEVLL